MSRATNKNFAPDDNKNSYAAYCLPRLISPAIQCSFLGYMWELYTTEFGWSKAEYGAIQWTYTLTQFFSFVILGVIAYFAFDNKTVTAAQEAEVGNNQKKLNYTIPIEVGGTVVHWITYFFLIFLPIKWHGVKTPYIDSMLGNTLRVWTLDFWRPMFKGPVPLSSMATSRGWYRFFCIPWCFVKLFWVILYPFMKVSFFCGGCCMSLLRMVPLHGNEILPVLETLDSIPPPTCSACCNTTCCNNFAMRMMHTKRWIQTRTFRLYFLVFIHGVAMSAHELSNKSILTYIYPEKQKNKDNVIQPNSETSGSSTAKDGPQDEKRTDVNLGKRGTLLSINLSVFFVSNLLIYLLFSLVKLYVHSKAAFAETFFLISILFFLAQIPILIYFYENTEYNFNGTPDANPTYDGTTSLSPPSNTDLDLKPVDNPGNLPKDCVKAVCATIWHGTILFWMFSGGPLTVYISVFVLGGHTGIMSFGVLINNFALTGTSWLFMIATKYTQNGYKAFTDHTVQIVIMSLCILGQFYVYYAFNAHDYLILILTGIINSLFVTYANITFDSAVKTKEIKQWKWIVYGGFYSVTNLILTPAMEIMFRSFGQNEIKHIARGCIRFDYHYCFPTVYRTITVICITINTIVFIPICVL